MASPARTAGRRTAGGDRSGPRGWRSRGPDRGQRPATSVDRIRQLTWAGGRASMAGESSSESIIESVHGPGFGGRRAALVVVVVLACAAAVGVVSLRSRNA